LAKIYPKLKPYDWKQDLSKQENIYYIKSQFYHLINNGEFINLLSYLYDEPLQDYEIKWNGNVPPDFKI
jgi:hypothetical protein